MDESASQEPQNQPEKGIVRPEFTPDRSPQPLSRNLDTRLGQLSRIVANPTENQKRQLEESDKSEDMDSTDSREQTENILRNLKESLDEQSVIDRKVAEARSAVLRATSADRVNYEEKKKAWMDAREESRRSREWLNDVSLHFIEAGVQLEPEQRDLSLGEKVLKGAYVTGFEGARVVSGAGAGLKSAGENVKAGVDKIKGMPGEIRSGITEGIAKMDSKGSEMAAIIDPKIEAAISYGRNAVSSAVTSAAESVRRTREESKNIWPNLVAEVRSMKEVPKEVGGLLSEAGRRIGVAGEKSREAITQTAAWKAADVWITKVEAKIAGKMEQIRKNERVDNFINSMREIGEKLGKITIKDNITGPIREFAETQAKRLGETKVGIEIKVNFDKGKVFLSPAWESIQKDRERVRDNTNVLMDKLGVVVASVSDAAAPVMDRILDKGRDARDVALGYSRKHIEGMQAFGRKIAEGIEATPAWNFLAERWESMRFRSNVARIRLNIFLDKKLGSKGTRLKKLQESAKANAERARIFISGIRIEPGKVLQNGKEVPENIRKWFVEQGAAAAESFTNEKERISKDMETLRRYWEISAVGRWVEAGMAKPDIQRRLKVMRAIGHASLDRAGKVGSITAATGLEVGKFFVYDKRGRLLLGVAALAFVLANNAHLIDSLQTFFQGSGVQLPHFDTIAAGPTGAESSAMPDAGVGITHSPDLTGGAAPDVSEAVPHTPVESVTASAPPGAEAVSPTPGVEQTAPSGTEAVGMPSPDLFTGQFWSQVHIGEPIQDQLNRLAQGLQGNPTDNYYKLLEQALPHYLENFRSTAQAIIDAPQGTYAPDQIQSAREQLDAISEALKSPVDASTIKGHDILMKAMHYWRPM